MQATTLYTHCLVLVAVMCALASGAAHAQSVALYGLIDTDIEYVSHANTNGNGLTRVLSVAGTLPSRWGLRGAEGLGNGMKAAFTLESGFNTDTDTSGRGSRLFGRQAQAGLTSNYDTVTLGQQCSMVLLSLADTDTLGPSQYTIDSLDAYVPNARADNIIAYKDTFSGPTMGATYSFGHDTTGSMLTPGICAGEAADNTSPCRVVSAMLKYGAVTFGVTGACGEQRGGASATASPFSGSTPITFTDTSDKDRRIVVNSYIKLGNTKLSVGWISHHVQAAAGDVHSNLYFVNGSYPLEDALTLDTGPIRLTNADQSHSATMVVLRDVYTLSKRTALYAQTGYLRSSANAQYPVGGGGGGTTPARGVNRLGATMRVWTAF